MTLTKKIFTFIVFCSLLFLCSNATAQTDSWEKLEEGMALGAFNPPKKSRVCDGYIFILKIDPKVNPLKLLSASEHGRKLRTVKQWSSEFGLFAGINASMYQSEDYLRSTGYMRNFSHVNNSHINKYFGSLMVFNPKDSSLPEVQIIDRRLQKNWRDIIKKYQTVVQDYRMISRGKRRGWPKRAVLYSTAAIGMDGENNVLFILGPAPYSTHDFIQILLSLPINIKHAMYVEGGPQATLYLKVGNRERQWTGTCESGLAKDGFRGSGRKIPNIVGVGRPNRE